MDVTFRPRSNFAWAAVGTVLIGLFAINSLMTVRDAAQTFFELVLCAILISTIYLLWVRPKLVLRDAVIEVINPLTSSRIPYADVVELETKWALTIVHKLGKTRVWVAPASGKRRWIADKTFGFYGKSLGMSEASSADAETMSGSLNSFSGQAAYLIRERIKRLH